MTRGAGKYRTPILIQRKSASATINSAGHIDETADATWETTGSVMAHVKYGVGRESMTGEQLTAADQVKVVVASSRAMRALTTDMRFKIGTRVFSISQPPVDVDESLMEVMFTAIEVR